MKNIYSANEVRQAHNVGTCGKTLKQAIEEVKKEYMPR